MTNLVTLLENIFKFCFLYEKYVFIQIVIRFVAMCALNNTPSIGSVNGLAQFTGTYTRDWDLMR